MLHADKTTEEFHSHSHSEKKQSYLRVKFRKSVLNRPLLP